MKNKLTDLNNHLFAQLERLGDEDLKADQLQIEIDRSRAISSIGKTIVENARLSLDAQIAIRERAIVGTDQIVGIEERK